MISVIVRAKDEAPSIGRTLEILAGQRVDHEVEVIVVDSGSADGTPGIARRHGATVLEIPAESFTFGGALNTGCAAASGELCVALSAHAFPRDDGWLARLAGAMASADVACASGLDFDVDGGPLTVPRRQDAELARRHPWWGYSNAAGVFRRDLWQQYPWRADMPGTEDKEWAWHWQQRGMVAVLDPALLVEHSHHHDPLPDVYERARREWHGYGMYLDLPRYGVAALVGEWWSERGAWPTHLRARLSHRRALRLVGKYTGLRRARRAA